MHKYVGIYLYMHKYVDIGLKLWHRQTMQNSWRDVIYMFLKHFQCKLHSNNKKMQKQKQYAI